MQIPDFAILVAMALACSILSAIIGMAGGIVLLSVMLLYFEPLTAIPLHGAIQLFSNSSRVVIQRRHVHWNLIWHYALPLLPMAGIGLLAAQQLSPQVAKICIGVFVLLATWRPDWLLLRSHPQSAQPARRFLVLGAVVGFLQMTVGATGPLIAPFFLNLGLSRQGVVGTKAAAQALGHITKIGVFATAGFVFADYLPLLAAMCAAVMIGTWLGSKLLDRVNERSFVWLYRGVLTLIALRLVIVATQRLVLTA